MTGWITIYKDYSCCSGEKRLRGDKADGYKTTAGSLVRDDGGLDKAVVKCCHILDVF